MVDRYSFAKEGPAPCNICGSNVREQLVPGDQRLGAVSGPSTVERICLDAECPSNDGADLRLTRGV